jgi:hypothetical protein
MRPGLVVFTRTVTSANKSEQEMGTQNFIVGYIQACTSGRLPFSECGPIWQLFVIAAFLVAAVATLLVLRMRPRTSAE